jgi:hypothetical protein
VHCTYAHTKKPPLLAILRRIIFQQDGAPPHYSRDVRDYLNLQFPNRWIGRNGPISWPPRSPDLTPMDFYVWGYMKDLVYSVPINTVDQLRDRIMEAGDKLRSSFECRQLNLSENLRKRARICVHEVGGHFEHLLWFKKYLCVSNLWKTLKNNVLEWIKMCLV